MLRNLAGIRNDGVLWWFNPTADDSWRELTAQAGNALLWCQNYATWRSLLAAGAPAEFGDFPDARIDAPSHVILSLPRSRQRLEMLLEYISSVLPDDGRLWLAGENRAGVKSSSGRLERHFASVRKLDSARHCGLFEATGRLRSKSFQPDRFRLEWQLPEALGGLKIVSWPGVFAHGRLDEGTRMLLEQLESVNPRGNILDFACGCGVISARVAQVSCGSRISMLDSDALALRAAGQTMEVNGFAARLSAGDGLGQLDTRYDMIVTNPPFHRDAAADTRLSMGLLEPVRNFLRPRGQLVMVVNRHIPYRRWLDGIFGSHVVLAASNRYQVLHAFCPG